MKISKVVSFLEELYPLKFAMDWDNCGLQVGNISDNINSIFVTLTLTDNELDRCIEKDANLILTHHPIIFKPINSLNINTPFGKLFQKIINNNITVYSMHTNLDVTRNGVNDVLAQQYGLSNTKIISVTNLVDLAKLIVYVPKNNFESFRDKFLTLNLGNIGNYSSCSFSGIGEGTFKGALGTNPHIGEPGILEKTEEYKIETIVKLSGANQVINQVREIHPYEEMAYDLIPVLNKDLSVGLGRYSSIEPISCQEFMDKYPGFYKGNTEPTKPIKKVGVCGGNGSSLVKRVIDLGLDLFISSEFSYHDELLAQDYGLMLLDLGHFNSEQPVIPHLQKILQDRFEGLGVFV